jgi:hypothetical protein
MLIEGTEELAVSQNHDMRLRAWDKIDAAQHKGRAILALPQSKDARTVPGEVGREVLIRTISLSYARNDLEPTSDATLRLYRRDAEHAADAILALRSPSVTGAGGTRRALTEIAAECHRAKWKFENEKDKRPFDDLHRIGDMALKLRDLAAVPQGQESDICPYCDTDMEDEANCPACGRERIIDELAPAQPAERSE